MVGVVEGRGDGMRGVKKEVARREEGAGGEMKGDLVTLHNVHTHREPTCIHTQSSSSCLVSFSTFFTGRKKMLVDN